MEKRSIIIIILLIPFFISWHWFEPAAKKNQNGIKAYREKNFDQALNEFLSAKGVRPNSAELKNNTASALYQMKKYKEALEEFSKIDPEKTNIPKAQFHYNMGNTFFRLNEFEKALENYKKSLIEQPSNLATKKNYELTLKKLEEKKKKDKQDKKKNKDEDKDKEKQENKQQQQQQQQQQKKQEKYKNIMQYLNQNEKKQMKDKKRQLGVVRKEKDW